MSLHFCYTTRSYVKNESIYYSCRWSKLRSDGLKVPIPLAIDCRISQLLIQHECVYRFSAGERASCQHCFEVSFHSSPFSGTFKKVRTLTPSIPVVILCTARFDIKKSTFCLQSVRLSKYCLWFSEQRFVL